MRTLTIFRAYRKADGLHRLMADVVDRCDLARENGYMGAYIDLANRRGRQADKFLHRLFAILEKLP